MREWSREIIEAFKLLRSLLFITLDFRSFFTGGTSPLPLADLDFCFGRTGVTSSSLTLLSFVAIEGSVGGLDCLADFFPLDSCCGHSDEFELLEDLHALFNTMLITNGVPIMTAYTNQVSISSLSTYFDRAALLKGLIF